MAIVLAYEKITGAQKIEIKKKLTEFKGEVSQLSLFENDCQLVLNNHQITAERGQEFLDFLIQTLKPSSWGTDLPLADRSQPPEGYTRRYSFSIPYDSSIM